jgi:hypothetical protein
MYPLDRSRTDCTPVSYPDIPSTHLHALWQVWDTALEDFLSQVPLETPIEGEPYVYRSPILLQELLQSIAGQLSLFANSDMSETERECASKLCAVRERASIQQEDSGPMYDICPFHRQRAQSEGNLHIACWRIRARSHSCRSWRRVTIAPRWIAGVLAIVLSACERGRYRTWALNLLAVCSLSL